MVRGGPCHGARPPAVGRSDPTVARGLGSWHRLCGSPPVNLHRGRSPRRRCRTARVDSEIGLPGIWSGLTRPALTGATCRQGGPRGPCHPGRVPTRNGTWCRRVLKLEGSGARVHRPPAVYSPPGPRDPCLRPAPRHPAPPGCAKRATTRRPGRSRPDRRAQDARAASRLACDHARSTMSPWPSSSTDRPTSTSGWPALDGGPDVRHRPHRGPSMSPCAGCSSGQASGSCSSPTPAWPRSRSSA
jgi:hypothetical protein